MNSVLGIGENIVFLNRGHVDWIGNKNQLASSTNESLIDFVFATKLFRDVRDYQLAHQK